MNKDIRLIKAEEAMTRDVKFIDADATVADAIKKMQEDGVSSLIVERTKAHDITQLLAKDSYGIVTRKDIVTKILTEGMYAASAKVSEIMTKPLITASPGLSLTDCAKLMRMTGVRRLPIFDGKRIVGILSNTDILNAIKLVEMSSP